MFFTAIAFADTRHGWLAGTDGLRATVDGGTHWDRQGPRGVPIVALDALNVRVAWAVGVDRLLGTTDGGRYWRRLEEPRYPLRAVSFVSGTVGFGVSVNPKRILPELQVYPDLALRGTPVSTVDGGRTWKIMRTLPSVNSLCFADPTAGWAAEGTRVWRTGNGGRTWRPAGTFSLRDPDGWTATTYCAGPAAVWVRFWGDGVAMEHVPYIVYHSLDGGKHWKADLEDAYTSNAYPPARAGLGYSGPLAVVNPATAFIVSVCPVCELPGSKGFGMVWIDGTHDGGGTWQRSTVTWLTMGPIAITSVNPTRGWMSGELNGRRELAATADGGRTWTPCRVG